MDPALLPVIWAAIIGFAILAYVLLDGFDLGVGILFGFASQEEDRRVMMSSIAPVWDGNETWLILVGAGLFGAFPVIYAVFLPAFYLPIALLLLALVFRGVAFEFRYRTVRMRWLWDTGFWLGSIIVAFVQGAAIGTLVRQIPVVDGQYAGGPFEWLSFFSVLCGIGLVITYALLGASWLVMKTEGHVRARAYGLLNWLLVAVLFFVVVTFLYAVNSDPRIMQRWTDTQLLFVLPQWVLFAAVALFVSTLTRQSDWVPFAASATIVTFAYLMLVTTFWPYMIPFSLTVEQAAAPAASLTFMFWGAGLVAFPVVLIYTISVYVLFRGKVRQAAEY